MGLCVCIIVGQMLKNQTSRESFNHPWIENLHFIVMNTVRLLMCVNMLST